MSLLEQRVLVLDCQSTGASPAHGSLLELGWVVASAAEPVPSEIAAHLIALPEGEEIPAAVSRVTGVRPDDMADAIEEGEAWRVLCAAASPAPFPTVVHYARFEESFLRDLQRRLGAAPFPFDMVCTHAIARRLLPELPRCSLRAVAGYFGFGPEHVRRSQGHVAATCLVWKHLAARLADEGVSDWRALRHWLAEPAPASRRRSYPMARERRLSLPDAPGVYRMRRVGGDLLYVGKATSLKRRVNSYFQKRSQVGERHLEMLSQARELDVSVTETVLEAALLESDEIKLHAPPYNVALREDGREAWFYRRDLRAAAPQPDADHELGPVPSRRSLRHLVVIGELLGYDPRTISLREARAALGIPVGHRLTPEAVRLGFEWFERTHRSRLGRPSDEPARRLLALGAALWRLHGALPEQPVRDEDDDGPWEPGRVTLELERRVMVGAQLVRRARLLCLLSESSVGWRPSPDSGLRYLTLCRGEVIERGYTDRLPPSPPGSARPVAERKQDFDIVLYDRLRTLTTELRRVLASSGEQHALVRLGERRLVEGPKLRRLLAVT